MGSFGAPSPPSAINPGATARQQYYYNVKSGIAGQAGSNVNQSNPYGNLTYKQTGVGPDGIPLYTAKTTLSPDQQYLFNLLQRSKGFAASDARDIMKGANYGDAPPGQVVGDMTSGLTGQLLDKYTSYLSPFFTQGTTALDGQLRNQGFKPGDPAYDKAMNNLKQSQNQSVTGFLAQAEPQAYQQATQSYMLPLTTAAALSGYGAPTQPQFGQTPGFNIQPPNYVGATANYGQAAQNTYTAQMQQYQAMMSGLFGIPSSVLGGWASSPAGGAALTSAFAMSDRRFKTDIEPVGELENGLKVYSYKFLGDSKPQLGVMADEVEKVIPDAVITIHGVKFVNYAKVLNHAL